jgi:hypothetical protein
LFHCALKIINGAVEQVENGYQFDLSKKSAGVMKILSFCYVLPGLIKIHITRHDKTQKI